MIKFVHKKHINLTPKTSKIIIYYSISDLILGLLLIILVGFFIYNYLMFSMGGIGPKSRAMTFSNNAEVYNKVLKNNSYDKEK